MITLEKTAQVWCINGNLGGGKTLTAVSMAVEAMRAGYYVVSNVTLNLPEIKREIPWADKLYQHIIVHNEEYDDDGKLVKQEDFNPFSIPSGSPRGSGGNKRVLVILDECAEWFDQYQSAKSPIVSRVLSWLRHSSKRSQDVVFIVQRREYLNKSFRLLVSRWVTVHDLATFRLPMFKIPPPFCGHFCLAVVTDKTENRIQPFCLISKKIYGKCYNTAECLAVGGLAAVEYEIPARKSEFPTIIYLAWLASLFALVAYAC